MSAKVYIVTSGAYSDYQINAVFSTREKAESFVNGGTDLYSIEEFPLDDYGEESVHKVWSARINAEGIVYTDETHEIKDSTCRGKTYPMTSYTPEYCVGKPHISVGVAESCVSAEHALKLAVEARQAWLRHYKLEVVK